MPGACLFCGLIESGQCPVVFENRATLAFLDHRPIFHGHTLVVPKAHFETLAVLPEKALRPFFESVRKIAVAVEQAMEAHGTFVAINNKVSQSVPHLHAHVVPRRFKDGLKGFFWPRTKYAGPAEMERVRRKIAAFL